VEGAPLRTEQFGRRYQRNRPWAIRDVTLEVPEGSITALVGPNGSGKTTLIRACLGFEPPNEGRVLVYGVDSRRNRTAAVNSIGYVPQQAALYRSLSIGDHRDIGRAARPSFDLAHALRRVTEADLSVDRKVGSSRAASRHRWDSRWRWGHEHRCSCSTSRWPASIRWPAAGF
jgi:ABC-type multidrug transport system ATPase subunit